MTALTIELEARASAVDAVLTLARVRMDDSVRVLGAGFYLCQAWYHLRKLVTELAQAMDTLRVHELDEIATMLGATSRRFGPRMRAQLHRPLNPFEQAVVTQSVKLFDEVDRLAVALRDRSESMKMAAPSINPVLLREARLAGAFMRSVTPDSAERHPDPDYGF